MQQFPSYLEVCHGACLLNARLLFGAAKDRDAAHECELLAQKFLPEPQLAEDLGQAPAASVETVATVEAAVAETTEDVPALATSSWDTIEVLEDSIDDAL